MFALSSTWDRYCRTTVQFVIDCYTASLSSLDSTINFALLSSSYFFLRSSDWAMGRLTGYTVYQVSPFFSACMRQFRSNKPSSTQKQSLRKSLRKQAKGKQDPFLGIRFVCYYLNASSSMCAILLFMNLADSMVDAVAITSDSSDSSPEDTTSTWVIYGTGKSRKE